MARTTRTRRPTRQQQRRTADLVLASVLCLVGAVILGCCVLVLTTPGGINPEYQAQGEFIMSMGLILGAGVFGVGAFVLNHDDR